MNRNSVSVRAHAIILATILAASPLAGNTAESAGSARFEFEATCSQQEDVEGIFGGLPEVSELLDVPSGSDCSAFTVKDPLTLETRSYKKGDLIDIQLVLQNPDNNPISRIRAWVAYDSSVLEGVSLQISSNFPTATPGEQDIVERDGLIKISGSTDTPINSSSIPVARIIMRVLDDSPASTPLSFFDASGTTGSRTGAFSSDGEEQNVLQTVLGSLLVNLQGGGQDAEQSSNSQQSSVGDNQTSDTAETDSGSHTESTSDTTDGAVEEDDTNHTASTDTVFYLLQVQNLRLTTEGGNVYLAWDTLPSSELVGYNVYYGTTTGRYIQRRSVERAANSITIRSLPVGTTYYFAVRGVNAAGEETEFSNEEGISVGNPSTSTSPLSASSIPKPTPGTGGTVSGETGVTSILTLFLVLSAVTGTVLAYKRQLAVSTQS